MIIFLKEKKYNYENTCTRNNLFYVSLFVKDALFLLWDFLVDLDVSFQLTLQLKKV